MIKLTEMYNDFLRVCNDGYYLPVSRVAPRVYLMRKWGIGERTAKFAVRMFVNRMFNTPA